MLVIRLGNVPGVEVPLNNLLIRHPAERHMLFVFVRVQPPAVRDLARRHARDHLPSLRVPELHHLVIRRAEELPPVVAEADVLDGEVVPKVRAHALAAPVDVPDLDLRIHASGQE
jgi:hypothetical protein